MALITAIMGSTQNPTAYMPPNAYNVVEGDSDDSVSTVTRSAAIKNVPALTAQLNDVATLMVPHLFWRCAVSGSKDSFPVTLNALFDHGSHAVLIRDNLVSTVGLKRRKLAVPMTVEMAMPKEGKKQTTELNEWVKLQLYNITGEWTSKSVRAVMAPSLCADVILGPFLSHNNIMIDHNARTAIDKTSNFDLLHPTPREIPKAPKK
jgi:hypothetical protein